MPQQQQVLQDRYHLLQQLGHNAGRQTWLAEDLAQQPVAQVIVKLLAFPDQVDWQTLKLFEREAKILKHLNHPQIPRYLDFFSIDDRVLWFGLVQEFIPGRSLKELLDQGERFSEKRICELATALLQILMYLHDLNPHVFHRDIKPSNLIWGEDGLLYLIDFGAVQDKAAAEGSTFTVVGTYGYVPMEQFGGRTVPSSDLYALGATLIHLLTGVAPADLPQEDLRLQFADQVTIHPSLVKWLEKLTYPNPVHRFSTAKLALESLQITLQSQQAGQLVTQKPRGLPASATPSFYQRPAYSSIQLSQAPQKLIIQIPVFANLIHAEIIIWVAITIMLPFIMMAIHERLVDVSLFINQLFVLRLASCFARIPLGIIAKQLGMTSLPMPEIDLFFFYGTGISTITLTRDRLTYYRKAEESSDFAARYKFGKVSIPTATIRDVIYHSHHINRKRSESTRRVLTIQTLHQDYSFVETISRQEARWLTQEIKQWLWAEQS